MTFREKIAKEHPEMLDAHTYIGGVNSCPFNYGYENPPTHLCDVDEDICRACWNREMPEIKEEEKDMTFKEKYRLDHPNSEFDFLNCPASHGYEDDQNDDLCNKYTTCSDCWNREIPEIKEDKKEMITATVPRKQPVPRILNNTCPDLIECGVAVTKGCVGCEYFDIHIIDEEVEKNKVATIKDSGDRTQFESGAVRDMREGKGRVDLMPLQVLAEYMDADQFLHYINAFFRSYDTMFLYDALKLFSEMAFKDNCTMILETAIHFEQGALKYGESNWQKGIPAKCYIDSALRHYFKYRRGDSDERHDRACVWNLMCCIWEVDYGEDYRSRKSIV